MVRWGRKESLESQVTRIRHVVVGNLQIISDEETLVAMKQPLYRKFCSRFQESSIYFLHGRLTDSQVHAVRDAALDFLTELHAVTNHIWEKQKNKPDFKFDDQEPLVELDLQFPSKTVIRETFGDPLDDSVEELLLIYIYCLAESEYSSTEVTEILTRAIQAVAILPHAPGVNSLYMKICFLTRQWFGDPAKHINAQLALKLGL